MEEQKDFYWKQHAHVKWLRQGDPNTSYFHAFASHHRRINRIKRMRREDGSWVEKSMLKDSIAAQYAQLFTSQGVTRLKEVIDKVKPSVTQMMNDTLSSPYT